MKNLIYTPPSPSKIYKNSVVSVIIISSRDSLTREKWDSVSV